MSGRSESIEQERRAEARALELYARHRCHWASTSAPHRSCQERSVLLWLRTKACKRSARAASSAFAFSRCTLWSRGAQPPGHALASQGYRLFLALMKD
eukprot:2256799-Rhodomonas_salina.1